MNVVQVRVIYILRFRLLGAIHESSWVYFFFFFFRVKNDLYCIEGPVAKYDRHFNISTFRCSAKWSFSEFFRVPDSYPGII